MAQVQTVDAPNVSASGGAIGVNAPAQAFGASVLGQGLKEAGAASEGMSTALEQRAMQMQELNNKAASDQAWQGFVSDAYKFSENWKQNNQRQAASANLTDAYKNLEELRQSHQGTLGSPMARAMFDQDSRRQLANISSGLASYASTQMSTWRKEVAIGKMATLADQIAADPTQLDSKDPNGPLVNYFRTKAQIDTENNVPPELAAAQNKEEYGKLVTGVVAGLQAQDKIQDALTVLDKHKGDMDVTSYNHLLGQIRPVMMAQEAHGIADDALNATLGSGSGSFLSRVRARENGPFGTNDSKNPNSSADGYDQFLRSTWTGLVSRHPDQFPEAKGLDATGVLGLRHNSAVADRATMLYAQDNAQYLTKHGIPATDATLGLAHAFGAGGAAAILKADPSQPISTILGPDAVSANKLNGKTAGEVAAQFGQNFGPARDSTDLEARLPLVVNEARRLAELKHPGDAAFADRAAEAARSRLSELHTGIQAGERDTAATLLSAVMSGATDMDSLNKAIPGAAAMYDKLPAEEQRKIDGYMKYEYDNSPSRVSRLRELDGALAAAKQGDPRAFLSDDLHGLNAQDTIYWQKQQALVGGKGAHTIGKSDDLADRVYKGPSVTAGLQQIFGQGLIPKDNDPRMLRFSGILRGEIEEWSQHFGKVPTSEEINSKILPRVFYQNALFMKEDLGDHPVEQSFYNRSRDLLTNLRGIAPSETDIGTHLARMREDAIFDLQASNLPTTGPNIARAMITRYQLAEATAKAK